MNPLAARRVLLRNMFSEYNKYWSGFVIFIGLVLMTLFVFAWTASLASLIVLSHFNFFAVSAIALYFGWQVLFAARAPHWYVFGIKSSIALWTRLGNKKSTLSRVLVARAKYCAKYIPGEPWHERYSVVFELSALLLFIVMLVGHLETQDYWNLIGSALIAVYLPLIEPLVPFLELAGIELVNTQSDSIIGAIATLGLQALIFFYVFTRFGGQYLRNFSQDAVLRLNWFALVEYVSATNHFEIVDFGPPDDAFSLPRTLKAREIEEAESAAFEELVGAWRAGRLDGFVTLARRPKPGKLVVWPSSHIVSKDALFRPGDISRIEVEDVELRIVHKNMLAFQPTAAMLDWKYGEMTIVDSAGRVAKLGPILIDFVGFLLPLKRLVMTRLSDGGDVETLGLPIELVGGSPKSIAAKFRPL